MSNDDPIRTLVASFLMAPPFSFTYGGVPFASVREAWAQTGRRRHLDGQRTQRTMSWTDPTTLLQVCCVAVAYHDFPCVEWTVTFKNGGTTDTPVIGDVLALDTTIQAGATEYIVHTNDGSTAQARDFGLRQFGLSPHQRYLFFPVGGRPTDGSMIGATMKEPVQGGGWPYYNIDAGDLGVILAIGWPGQWVCQMTRDGSTGLHLQAGMSSQPHTGYASAATLDDARLLRTVLHAGESVRTPLIVLQTWGDGDWIAAQNTWRRWMLAHNTPQILTSAAPTGTPSYQPPPPTCPTGSVSDYTGSVDDPRGKRLGWMEGTAADEVTWLTGPDGYVVHGAVAGPDGTAVTGDTFDHWWMDAGWNASNGTDGWVSSVGNWTPDPTRFPTGLKPISDLAHAHNMKFVLWHEPERAVQGTAAYNHPFFLDNPDQRPLSGTMRVKLLNWGDPAGLAWAIETFDGSIVNNGVDVFRQDFNMAPLPYWSACDTADRRGYTQAKWVEGLLSFWDELRRRHPGVLIDTCASGGRRLDLESLRRAVPLTRSDYRFEPMGLQGHTYGLSFWVPYSGDGTGPMVDRGGAYGSAAYVMRSDYCPSFASSVDIRRASEEDWRTMTRMTAEWWQIAPCLLGDYYPLTSYDNHNQDVWIAWQFDRPEAGEGVVQVFRRQTSTTESMAFPLRGLDVAARYSIVDIDTAAPTIYTGALLASTGLPVTLSSAGSAGVYRYTRLRPGLDR